MAVLRDLVLDCADPQAQAAFYCAVLDGYAVEPHTAEALAWLDREGIPVDDAPNVLIAGAEGQPRIWFVKVPEPRVVKNRFHPDLWADDFDAELARILALGATLADDQPTDKWRVLHDPEGNELCLLRSWD